MAYALLRADILPLMQRPRIVAASSKHGSDVGDTDAVPLPASAPTRADTDRARNAARPSEHFSPRTAPASIEAPTSSCGVPSANTPDEPLALTKEALERNSRKVGPRPDLQRRVSRFLEEISEAEESPEVAVLPAIPESSSGLAASPAATVAEKSAVVLADPCGPVVKVRALLSPVQQRAKADLGYNHDSPSPLSVLRLLSLRPSSGMLP